MPAEGEFLKLFLAHQREIGAFVSAAVRDANVRDDIVQQTALILWRTFDQYDRTRPFVSWARGIARNVILQHHRKSERNPVLLEPGALDAVMEACNETREEDPGLYQEALQHCLRRITPKSRQLLEMRYQRSLSLAEMADLVHSTLNAVNQALFRIRAALQTCIGNYRRALMQEGKL